MKKTFAIFLMLSMLFAFAGCSSDDRYSVHYAANTNLPKTTSYTIESEMYEPQIPLTGVISSAKKTVVATKAPGRIDSLFVEIGDYVVSGDLMGELAGDETIVTMNMALNDKNNVQKVYNAQEKLLNEQVAGANKILEKAETALKAAKRNFSDTKHTTNEQKELAQQNVGQVETALENVKAASIRRIESHYETAPSTIRVAVLAAANAHSFAENLLEVNESKSNSYYDKYKTYLGALNSQSERDARNALEKSYKLYVEFMEFTVNAENFNGDYEKWDKYMEEALIMMEATQDMMSKTYIMLSHSITASSFPSTLLQGLKQEAIIHSQNVESAILSASGGVKIGAKGWISTLEEIYTQNEVEMNTVNSTLLTAKQQVNQVDAGASQNVALSSSQVNLLEKDVEQAKIALLSVEAARETALRQQIRELNIISGNAALSEVGLSNTKVIASFDGVVTNKFVEEGQVVAAGQPVFEISNLSELKIKTDLPDIYIGKLENNLKADIVIDGLPGIYNAMITKIDPQVNPATHKLGIELTLDEIPESAKIGQFARIKLKLPEEVAYFIPMIFVQRDFEGSYVTLNNDEEIEIVIENEVDEKVKVWWPGIEDSIVLTR
jgi:RND family efflux transporter MFP subunit